MAKEIMKDRADVSVIRQDINALKEDAQVVMDDAKVLGRDLRKEGKKQLSAAEEQAKEAFEQAKVKGRDKYEEMTSYVRDNPGQSIAIAFVGGVVASLLLGSRR